MSDDRDLKSIARALVAPGKGILAADECAVTMASRFRRIDVECTLASRREYRTIAFTTPGLGELVSGVILQDETLRQSALDGTPMVELLRERGMIAGINVDNGLAPLPGSPREFITEGLDGLPKRLREARALGASFAKWRGFIAMGSDLPTEKGIQANAQALALYSAACQEAGLVPIVEPEVAMDGTHTATRHREVTEIVLRRVFDELSRFGVALEGIVLKTNMVLSGTECREQASTDDVAAMTLETLMRTVPPAVPGVVFLSGGQSPNEATSRLAAINARCPTPPWALGYAYGRAMQADALTAWAGKLANAESCQGTLLVRARLLSEARRGRYDSYLQ